MQKELSLKTVVVKKDITKDELREILSQITDEDFNGNNGEEYFETKLVDGKEVPDASSLDCLLRGFNPPTKFDKRSGYIRKFILSVLDANYLENSYYYDFESEILDIADSLVVSIAYTE